MICPNCLFNVRPSEVNNLEYGCMKCGCFSSKEYWESPKCLTFPIDHEKQNISISCKYCASMMLPTAELTFRRSNGSIGFVFACHQHYSAEFYGENIDLTPFRQFNADLWNCSKVYSEAENTILNELGINEEIMIGERIRYAR